MTTRKQKKLLLIAILSLTIVFCLPAVSHAAGLVPCGGPSEKPCTVLDAFYMLARVTNWLIMTAGIYAVFKLIWAGFDLVDSAGREEHITKAREQISEVIIGFFIVLGAYMFVNTAVNALLMSKCKINFASPWTYITMTNPNSPSCLGLKPGDPGYNDFNASGGIVPGGQPEPHM